MKWVPFFEASFLVEVVLRHVRTQTLPLSNLPKFEFKMSMQPIQDLEIVRLRFSCHQAMAKEEINEYWSRLCGTSIQLSDSVKRNWVCRWFTNSAVGLEELLVHALDDFAQRETLTKAGVSKRMERRLRAFGRGSNASTSPSDGFGMKASLSEGETSGGICSS